MRLKQVLPVALVASITIETALSVKHPDTFGPQPKPHVELNLAATSTATLPPAIPASGGIGPADRGT